jgi:hypothetical protein
MTESREELGIILLSDLIAAGADIFAIFKGGNDRHELATTLNDFAWHTEVCDLTMSVGLTDKQ